jgi:MFS family permease
LLALSLGSLSFGFIKMPELGFQNWQTGGTILSGIVFLILFIGHEANSNKPMLPLKLFLSSTFSGSNLLTLFLYGALSAGLFFLSLNMIQIQAYSQTLAGLSTIPFGLLLTLLSRKIGSLADRFGARQFLITGPAITGFGFFLLSFPTFTDPSHYWQTFFPGIFTVGLGMSITVAPLTTTVMSSAGQQYSGTASGINNAVSRIAGVLAIAVMGAIVLFTFQHNLNNKMTTLFLSPKTVNELMIESTKLAETLPPNDLPIKLQQEIRQAIKQSFIEAYKLVMLICAVLSEISAIFAFFFIIQSNKLTLQNSSPEIEFQL